MDYKLLGKSAKDSTEPKRLDKAPSFQKLSQRNLAIAEAVVDVAKQTAKTPAQVAINWIRSRSVIPILGARTLAQLEDNLKCLEWTLEQEHLERLDQASHIELGFPTDFLLRVRELLHGGSFEWIQP